MERPAEVWGAYSPQAQSGWHCLCKGDGTGSQTVCEWLFLHGDGGAEHGDGIWTTELRTSTAWPSSQQVCADRRTNRARPIPLERSARLLFSKGTRAGPVEFSR